MQIRNSQEVYQLSNDNRHMASQQSHILNASDTHRIERRDRMLFGHHAPFSGALTAHRALRPSCLVSRFAPLASAFALAACLAFAPHAPAFADDPPTSTDDGPTRIHVLPFEYTDCIVLESQGRFGIVDSGEDSDRPDGSDPRYPDRPGIVHGNGREAEVIAYLEGLGVNETNLEFYLGTHPHSDHIGSADEIIRAFKPTRVYVPEYSDGYILNPDRLWDNQYVYDQMLAAADELGIPVILNLDATAPLVPHEYDEPTDPDNPENPEDPTDPSDPTDPDNPSDPANPENQDDPADPSDSEDATSPDDQTDPSDSEGEAGGGDETPGTGTGDGSDVPDPDEPAFPPHTGRPTFSLGAFDIEIVNFEDVSYKTLGTNDCNDFCWGVSARAFDSHAFLAGDITDNDGDEQRLAQKLGRVDVIKLAHHGYAESNTPTLIAAIEPRYAFLTGPEARLSTETDQILRIFDTQVYGAYPAAKHGYPAMIAEFAPEGAITVNVEDGMPYLDAYDKAPYAFSTLNGRPYPLFGWHEADGKTYWFENAAKPSRNAWVCDSGTWYRLDKAGDKLTGWQTISGTRYLFDESGAMVTGWVNDDGLRRYYDPVTAYAALGWQLIDNKWYFFDNAGVMQTGWILDGGAWYWLAPSNGVMATGWLKDGNTWYHLGPSGAMDTGWLKKGGVWYWLKPSSGAMATGWFRVSGTWYYANSSGAMQTGWLKDGGKWYWLDGSGAMRTGWVSVGGKWYWLDSSGAMKTGWLKDGGAWYWLDGSGAMATGRRVVNGSVEYFSPSGVWLG
ncbi:MBL fold metallo-hydrolase [Eggerthellaceae bacterium zg-893]|nr:MBL fold metallo-hydrolase [Eggerthellaceae bacterium zg-893]